MSRGNPATSMTEDLALPCPGELSPEALPAHVGIIMDGNGRWAQGRDLSREEGHLEGAEAVRRVVTAARELGVKALTLYAFSSQNWNRPPAEVVHLMKLLKSFLKKEREEIMDNGIRLETIGDTELLPLAVQKPLRALIEESSGNKGMILCLALSYGGRETIAQAAQRMCEAAVAGTLKPETITPEVFSSYLQSSSKLPPLDLLIRTSGEQRISNFFLWEVAYSELYFTDEFWPEFGRPSLERAFECYATRKRRFGLVDEQVTPEASTLSGATASEDVMSTIEKLVGTIPDAHLADVRNEVHHMLANRDKYRL